MTNNSHLELMQTDRPVINTWRSLSRFTLPRYSFDAGASKSFIEFVTTSPDTSVRHADLSFAEDGSRFTADLYVEGKDYDDALDTTVTAALGGLVCAGISISAVEVMSVHLAWLREMQVNHEATTAQLDKAQYEVDELDALMAFASARIIQTAA